MITAALWGRVLKRSTPLLHRGMGYSSLKILKITGVP